MLEEESGKRWSDLRREEENGRPKDEPRITSLSLTPERTELKVGQTSVLTATVNMTGGRYRGLVRWRSSDSSVMTVTASGAQMATVTCVGRGSCRITAEAEGCSQSCLCIGLEEQKTPPVPILAAVILAVVICIGIFVFISGGSGGGRSDSTENADNTTETETDTVAIEPDSEPDSEPVVSSLELDGTTAELTEGESLVLTATVAMSEGDYAGTVQWSSSDTSVATVESTGALTARVTYVGAGSCTVTATADDRSQSCQITCTAPEVTSLELDPTSAELSKGESTTLKATVGMSVGDYTGTIQWSSSDTSVATVESTGALTARVTYVGAGSCTVTATADGQARSCQITCTAPEVTSLELDSTAAELSEGGSTTLKATVGMSVGDYTGTVQWSSSDTSVATVESTGALTARVTYVGAGSCTVTATAGDYTRSCQITCARTRSLNNTMGNVGTTGEGVSLDGTTKKGSITEVYFLDSLSDAPSDAKDLSADGGGGVLCWTEGSTLYIAGEGGVTAGSSCESLFHGYKNLTAIHFSGNFDTSNVKNMKKMFFNCMELKSLDVSDWDTSNVTNMTGTFDQCESLVTLDLSRWDVSSVTNLYGTFAYCISLTNLDVSTWDTSRVTNMEATFSQCYSLTSLDLSGWKTSNVTTMESMFNMVISKGMTSSLKYLDLSGWDTSRVENMQEMFKDCCSLEDFDPWVLDTSHADTTDMYIGTDWEWISN